MGKKWLGLRNRCFEKRKSTDEGVWVCTDDGVWVEISLGTKLNARNKVFAPLFSKSGKGAKHRIVKCIKFGEVRLCAERV